jgi:aminomethyltransferase
MGQVILRNPGGAAGAASALERLCPQDLTGLAEGRQRYALFTGADGGILDDLMVANRGDHLFLVVNAANATADVAHLVAGLPDCTVEPVTDRALIALQGPGAVAALEPLAPGVAGMRFMDVATVAVAGGELWVSRSGYTGEDGFEISLPAAAAEGFPRPAGQPGVAPVGLGARDSLRLEAGLCLYGHDIDTRTYARPRRGLAGRSRRRRSGGRGRAGSPVPTASCANSRRPGAPARRACVRKGGRRCARARRCLPVKRMVRRARGARHLGRVRPIARCAPLPWAMCPPPCAVPGTRLFGEVRGQAPAGDGFRPCPSAPHSYRR